MATTADIRNGLVLDINGDLLSIVEFLHVKPGKGGAFVRTKLKNVRTGQVLDKTFRAGEKIRPVRIEKQKMQYLYNADDLYYFMNEETYDQIPVDYKIIEDALKYIKEGMSVQIQFHGEEALGVDLPITVELQIVQTDPGIRGDTATGGTKPATLETGAVVNVPLFVQEGETIKVDTRTGDYLERVS